MVGNQIDNLILNPSFGHNLCFNYSNGSCEPILDIYVSRASQSYKELFNIMNFNSWHCFLKIWESIGSPTPEVGAHLEVCEFVPSHFPTLLKTWNVTPGLHSQPALLHALTMVMSSRLRLWHYKSMILNNKILVLWKNKKKIKIQGWMQGGILKGM